jgi:stage II sporulation protein AB (anti-sigma F factor)
MNQMNEMRLQFTAQSQNESFARVAIAAFVSRLDLTVEEMTDIKTAVSEAVTNAIVHGYESSMGYVTLECRIIGGLVEIVVSDSGKGIEDVEKARQPLYTGRPDMERSGMGFTVMETFMDQVLVQSTPGLGTIVTMKKKLREQ